MPNIETINLLQATDIHEFFCLNGDAQTYPGRMMPVDLFSIV